jgi:hypothetical protein
LVRFPATICAGLWFATASAASVVWADPTAGDLQAQGEDLAKQGRFSEAIDSFKAADKLAPSATHACLIALAYTRRELWPQAEVWLALCQVRANEKDPLPEWAPAEQDQINERLAAANVAAVQIEVQPPDAGAKLTVSSFAPDEVFSPRTIHLPPGIHQIIAHAPGYGDQNQLVDIKDKTPQHVVIKLQKAEEGPRLPPVAGPERPTSSGKTLMIAGGATILVGFGTWAWMGYERSKLTDTYGEYTTHEGRYDVARVATIGLWAVGAGLAITGYVLHSRHHDEAPAVGVAPTHGGGMLSLEWAR